MLEEAKVKLQAEMDATKKDAYVQYIGTFLMAHLDKNYGDAEHILATDKTIAKSLENMKKEAGKKRVGNMAMLTPEEGHTCVLQYFGIGNAPASFLIAPTAPAAAFSTSLDDYL